MQFAIGLIALDFVIRERHISNPTVQSNVYDHSWRLTTFVPA